MKVVGVKQLKARLSEYVRLVRAGETALVTDRDEVVAELRPARRHAQPSDELEEVLDRLAEAGEVTRASLPKRDWPWSVKGLGLPPRNGGGPARRGPRRARRRLTAAAAFADAERAIAMIWGRCDLWELTPAVCELAGQLVPSRPLRSLEALHLATFVVAPRRLPDLALVTVDQRLAEAAGVA